MTKIYVPVHWWAVHLEARLISQNNVSLLPLETSQNNVELKKNWSRNHKEKFLFQVSSDRFL